MRFELSGHVVNLGPPVPPADHAFPITGNGNVDIKHYRDLGYTHFDVICIGAAGGQGGSISHPDTLDDILCWGGAGGGGGLHKISGLLSALPNSVAVVVGSAGNPGSSHATDPALTTDGQDGGYSSFGTACQASGGKGGKRVQVKSLSASSHADGGQGGVGGTTVAGGGGAGGIACIPKPPGVPSDGSDQPGTDGIDGTWDGAIGKGGGGGAGGVAVFGSPGVYQTAGYGTTGGDGSYNPADLSVTAPGQMAQDTGPGPYFSVVPGSAGGGKATPLNGLPTLYGCSMSATADGIVIVFVSS